MAHSFFATLKETFILLGLHFKTKLSNFIEYLRVAFKYYPRWTFFKIDTALLLSYLWTNPFRISKRFSLAKGEPEIYTYGETPLTTLERIAKECYLSAQDVVFELGCGRGRTCFWLNQFIGCTVVGIDYVPTFIAKAQQVKELFHVQGTSFHLEDLFQADLKGATVIYLYGTCYSDAQINQLIVHFSHLPVGTKIITVSYALTDFQPKISFKVMKVFSAPFTWGAADVYLQVKH